MNNKQNLHTHSTYVDGKDTPEEMLLEAIKRGFDAVGFSEHTFLPTSNLSKQMNEDGTELYKKEIKALKEKYRGIIDVFCGLEYESYSTVSPDGCDYLIGSVHYLDVNGKIVGFDKALAPTLDYVNEHFGGDGLKFAKAYFERVALLPEILDFDILGHFDVLVKNNEKGKFIDVNSKEYLDMGFSAIHALKGKIPLFEVNTGAISRGYTTAPYPQIDFLREFRELGFGAVITSDCHDKNFIDCYFEESRALLEAAGFKSRWILTDNGFVEVEL